MQTCPIPEGAITSLAERPGRMERLHVLLVEDHADTAQSLAPILRREGHAVRVALDGETAAQSAEEEPPDVVLLDLDVPGLDGYRVAQSIREQSHPKRPFLIGATEHGADLKRRRLPDGGHRPASGQADGHRVPVEPLVAVANHHFGAAGVPPCG